MLKKVGDEPGFQTMLYKQVPAKGVPVESEPKRAPEEVAFFVRDWRQRFSAFDCRDCLHSQKELGQLKNLQPTVSKY